MVREETKASLIRRISQTTGFKESEIVLLRASLSPEDWTYKFCRFAVNGESFWTDFKDWGRAKAFSLIKEGE